MNNGHGLSLKRLFNRQADGVDEAPNASPPAAARKQEKPAFPFTAVVGQEELKLALQLCVVDPTIGGVLVMGHRGTAKSTAVRSLAALLPRLDRVANCPYNCDPEAPSPLCPHCRGGGTAVTHKLSDLVPVVDLPLGATEDRVAGSLDVERALVDSVQAFAPGLLARANRGFLYIDEVNLLEDHLVDLLLDRFGLHARITTIVDIEPRVEIVRRRRAYDADPDAFAAAWEPEQEKLRNRLLQAQQHQTKVDLTDDTIAAAASLCVALEVDGHRGELTLCRAAVALAALNGRPHTRPKMSPKLPRWPCCTACAKIRWRTSATTFASAAPLPNYSLNKHHAATEIHRNRV